MTKDEALKMAINTLCNCGLQIGGQALISPYIHETVYVCNEALEQPAEPRLVSYALDGSTCTLNIDGEEVYFNREQPAQEVECSNHPDAPHGFCRDASHSAGRYVCECEGWQVEQPAQEPVGWLDPKQDINECFITHELKKAHEFQNSYAGNWNIPLYTHPHQWVGLTDDDVHEILGYCVPEQDFIVKAAIYKTEAKLKEKNHD